MIDLPNKVINIEQELALLHKTATFDEQINIVRRIFSDDSPYSFVRRKLSTANDALSEEHVDGVVTSVIEALAMTSYCDAYAHWYRDCPEGFLPTKYAELHDLFTAGIGVSPTLLFPELNLQKSLQQLLDHSHSTVRFPSMPFRDAPRYGDCVNSTGLATVLIVRSDRDSECWFAAHVGYSTVYIRRGEEGFVEKDTDGLLRLNKFELSTCLPLYDSRRFADTQVLNERVRQVYSYFLQQPGAPEKLEYPYDTWHIATLELDGDNGLRHAVIHQ